MKKNRAPSLPHQWEQGCLIHFSYGMESVPLIVVTISTSMLEEMSYCHFNQFHGRSRSKRQRHTGQKCFDSTQFRYSYSFLTRAAFSWRILNLLQHPYMGGGLISFEIDGKIHRKLLSRSEVGKNRVFSTSVARQMVMATSYVYVFGHLSKCAI